MRLLSESVSTLPLKLYRRKPDGSREPATDHPLYRVLCRSPNIEMTPQRFMLMVVASICLRGNAFIEKKMIGNRLVALVPLLPQCMTVKRLDNGRLEYRYNRIIYYYGSETVEVVFLTDGTVDVVYNSGLLRGP